MSKKCLFGFPYFLRLSGFSTNWTLARLNIGHLKYFEMKLKLAQEVIFELNLGWHISFTLFPMQYLYPKKSEIVNTFHSVHNKYGINLICLRWTLLWLTNYDRVSICINVYLRELQSASFSILLCIAHRVAMSKIFNILWPHCIPRYTTFTLKQTSVTWKIVKVENLKFAFASTFSRREWKSYLKKNSFK